MHELQKLNCYNHVFFKCLQVLELDLKFVAVKKKVVQVFESRWNVFASIWFFFQAPQYWCDEHFNIIFLVNGVLLILKSSPTNLLKVTLLLGILLGYFFRFKWYDTNCFEELEGG